jgi:hypothetical protein
LRPSRITAASCLGVLLLAGSGACLIACGLSGEGTAADIGAEGGHGGGQTDAAGDDAKPGSEAAADVTLADDATVDSPGGSTLDAGGDAPSDGAVAETSDAAQPADAADAGAMADADGSSSLDATAGPDGGADGGSPDAPADRAAPVDAASGLEDAPSSEGGSAAPDATADAGSCDFDGIWGSRLTIDVTWSPQGLTGIILASGSGQIKQWTKGVRTQTGLATSDATVVCGVALPDFQETTIAGGETYGVRFPDSLFDNDGGVLPTFTVSAVLSGAGPGSTYSTTTTAALLGLTMANPTTDPWPATITTEVDMDHDGKPGITIDTAQGAPYSDIPTGLPPLFGQPVRANKLYVAIRQVTVVSGNVDDCDHMSGTVSIPQIDSKYAIDSHVMGCGLVDGGDCSTTPAQTSQASFVDNTQPVFSPSGTTDFHSLRLPAGATCADVRAALP